MYRVKNFSIFIGESTDTDELFIKLGDSGPNVKDLQNSLESLGFDLPKFGIDSKFGPETYGASKDTISAISRLTNLDDIIGDPTVTNFQEGGLTQVQYNVIVLVARHPELVEEIRSKLSTEMNSTTPPTAGSAGTGSGPTGDLIFTNLMQKFNTDPGAFEAKVTSISQKLGINPNWLLLVMYKESGLNPKAQNHTTGATGLIQFMPDTASGLGTTTFALESMSGVDQLDYVYRYLSHWAGKLHSVIDVYMTVFYPVAIAHDDSFVIGSERSEAFAQKVAKQNPAISHGKETITKGDFKSYVLGGLPVAIVDKINNQNVA